MALRHTNPQCLPKSKPLHLTPLRSRLSRPVVRAAISPMPDVADKASNHTDSLATKPKLRILSSISACVEIDALVSRFEVFAGRSAMLGVSIAICVELLTEDSFFRASSNDEALLVGSLGLAAVCSAAVLAVTSKRRFGGQLLEAVITSLTAAKRSAASFTQRQVDKAVDAVFDRTFSSERLREFTNSLIAEEDLY